MSCQYHADQDAVACNVVTQHVVQVCSRGIMTWAVLMFMQGLANRRRRCKGPVIPPFLQSRTPRSGRHETNSAGMSCS